MKSFVSISLKSSNIIFMTFSFREILYLFKYLNINRRTWNIKVEMLFMNSLLYVFTHLTNFEI